VDGSVKARAGWFGLADSARSGQDGTVKDCRGLACTGLERSGEAWMGLDWPTWNGVSRRAVDGMP